MKKLSGLLKNRWARSVIIPFALFFCTGWYSGWQYLYLLLINEGAMSWYCLDCNEDSVYWVPNKQACIRDDEEPICKEQDNGLQTLYTMMTSAEFCGGIIAGLLYDMVGYRLSLMIGYCLHLFGIFSVTQSSRQVQLYIPGAFLSGLAVKIVAYPGYNCPLIHPQMD